MPRKPIDLEAVKRIDARVAELRRLHPEAFGARLGDTPAAVEATLAATIGPDRPDAPEDAAALAEAKRAKQRAANAAWREKRRIELRGDPAPAKRGPKGMDGEQVAARIPVALLARVDALAARRARTRASLYSRSDAFRDLLAGAIDAADTADLGAIAHESARACVDAAGPDWAWDLSARGIADLPTPADFVEAESAMGRPLTPPERRTFAAAYRAEVERLAVGKMPA